MKEDHEVSGQSEPHMVEAGVGYTVRPSIKNALDL
jgi:hypothetical protein